MPPTVAIVSLGTTPGLRVADAALAADLAASGVRCRVLRMRLGAAGRLRRQISVTDAVESIAAARVARAARGADAVILSTSTAAFFPRPSVPYAIRFDAPAAATRHGAAGAWQRAAERRAFRAAPLLLPYGEAAAAAAAAVLGCDAGSRGGAEAGAGPRIIPVPVAVEAASPAAARDIAAIAYAAYPRLRRLELLAEAWARLGPQDGPFVVAGLPPEAGRAYLRAHGVAEPPGLEWAGELPRSAWLAALARSRSFASAAAREGHGQAALEALAAGAPVATTAAAGAYEAPRLLEQIDPGLVAAAATPDALAAAWERALRPATAAKLAAQSPALLAPLQPAAVRRVVAEHVLPALGLAASR
ncbi:MAG: glycosyltransferase [Solirubrobacteraceae bacterium]